MSDVMRKPYYARKKIGVAWGKLVIHEKKILKALKTLEDIHKRKEFSGQCRLKTHKLLLNLAI